MIDIRWIDFNACDFVGWTGSPRRTDVGDNLECLYEQLYAQMMEFDWEVCKEPNSNKIYGVWGGWA